jgi:hypothetical protein
MEVVSGAPLLVSDPLLQTAPAKLDVAPFIHPVLTNSGYSTMLDLAPSIRQVLTTSDCFNCEITAGPLDGFVREFDSLRSKVDVISSRITEGNPSLNSSDLTSLRSEL